LIKKFLSWRDIWDKKFFQIKAESIPGALKMAKNKQVFLLLIMPLKINCLRFELLGFITTFADLFRKGLISINN